MYSTKSRALILLTVIWLMARVYPAMMGWSSFAVDGEIQKARKLLEYGVCRLHGAMLDPAVVHGRIAHPEHYYYSHGPYPIFWFYTALYYSLGFVGVAAALYLLKYGAFVLSFLLLDHCFARPAAFWAALLYSLAPLSILFDGASNHIMLATIFWPLGVALVLCRFRRQETLSLGGLALVGATAFVAGQTCWFALSILPSLAVINRRVTSLRPRALRELAADPVTLALAAGGLLSLLVFLGQIACYEDGLGPFMKYASTKAGKSLALGTKLYVMGLVPLRIGFFVGPGLVLASLVGCLWLVRDRNLRCKPLVLGTVSYFTVFGAMVLVAPAAFVQENHFYSYLVFPGAVVAALVLEQAGRWLRGLLLGLGGVSLMLGLMYAAVPVWGSPVSVYLGELFAAHSKQTDFLFTNIKPLGRPYKTSDIGGSATTQSTADRFITFGVVEPDQLCLAKDLISEDSKFLYWRLRSLPIGPALEAELAAKGRLLETIPVTFPAVTETLPEKLRSFVWHSVMKKGQRLEQGSGPVSDVMELYEIELAPTNLVETFSPSWVAPPSTNAPPALPQE